MTAEVGILNRIGVALAADSAVTIGQDANKIYTSAEKIFQLSYNAPVGIMVYGNADFVGLPWETIVKEFRRDLGNSTFDKLESYAKHFFDFIKKSKSMFPREKQDERMLLLIQLLFLYVREKATKVLDREAEKRDGLDKDEIALILDLIVSDQLKRIRSRPLLSDLTPAAKTRIRSRLAKKVATVKKHVYGKLPMRQGTSRKISSLAWEMISRHFFSPMQAGIVITGFGDQEFMPCLYSYDIEEMVENQPRVMLRNKQVIALDNNAAIMPFAQQEMVHSFMQGIDQELNEHMRSSTETLMNGVVDVIIDSISSTDSQYKDELNKQLKPEVKKLLKGLFEDWNNKTKSNWKPVVQIVASLPKDELAAMAEAMVNLTKFRRRVTPEKETVGGPIDVAVITKGDGFIWAKRKHYFDPSINPRAITKFKREVM